MARAGPAPPRPPPSASHWQSSAGEDTGESPGTTADALSAARTHFCFDHIPSAQRLLAQGKGRRAQAAFRPACCPGSSQGPAATHPPDARQRSRGPKTLSTSPDSALPGEGTRLSGATRAVSSQRSPSELSAIV